METGKVLDGKFSVLLESMKSYVIWNKISECVETFLSDNSEILIGDYLKNGKVKFQLTTNMNPNIEPPFILIEVPKNKYSFISIDEHETDVLIMDETCFVVKSLNKRKNLLNPKGL